MTDTFKCPCGAATEFPYGPFVCPGCGKAGYRLRFQPGRPAIAAAMLEVFRASLEGGSPVCRFHHDMEVFDYDDGEENDELPSNAGYLIHLDGVVDVMKFIHAFQAAFYGHMQSETGDKNADPHEWWREVSADNVER